MCCLAAVPPFEALWCCHWQGLWLQKQASPVHDDFRLTPCGRQCCHLKLCDSSCHRHVTHMLACRVLLTRSTCKSRCHASSQGWQTQPGSYLQPAQQPKRHLKRSSVSSRGRQQRQPHCKMLRLSCTGCKSECCFTLQLSLGLHGVWQPYCEQIGHPNRAHTEWFHLLNLKSDSLRGLRALCCLRILFLALCCVA